MPRVKYGTAVQGVIKKYQEPKGTPEELRATWERSQEYLYRIMSYAPKDTYEPMTKEELEEERRYFKFLRLGPRAGHFRHENKSKLTSADVLYILTCTIPAKNLEPIYNVSHETINGIRRNQFKEWSWEYYFVKRIKTMVKGRIYEMRDNPYPVDKKQQVGIRFYKIEVLQKDNTFKVIAYASGIRKARALREELCPKREFEQRTKNKTLNIVWPITRIDLI